MCIHADTPHQKGGESVKTYVHTCSRTQEHAYSCSTRLLELRCNRVRTHVINFQINLDLSRTEFKYIPPDAGGLLEF